MPNPSQSFLPQRPERVRTEVMRWEEPHHPGPLAQLGTHANPRSPTLQHITGRVLETVRRTELVHRRPNAGFPLCEGENRRRLKAAIGAARRPFLQAPLQGPAAENALLPASSGRRWGIVGID